MQNLENKHEVQPTKEAPLPTSGIFSDPISDNREFFVDFDIPQKPGHSVSIDAHPDDEQVWAHYSAPDAKDYRSRSIDKSWFVNAGDKLYYNAKEDALVEYSKGDNPAVMERHSVSFNLVEQQSEVAVGVGLSKGDTLVYDKAARRKSRERTYLAVPYAERDQAKELGAKWDRKTKSWFAPSAKVVQATRKWSVEGKAPKAEQSREPQQEFSDWVKARGMDLKGLATMDGKWHRIAIVGEREKNASYRGFLEGGVPNGMLNNFKGEQDKWVFTGQQLSKDEITRAIEAGQQAKKERAEELKQEQQATAKRAYGIWANLKDWAKPSNCEYLKRKNVLGYGVKLDKDGRMVVPLRDTDFKIHSLQFVGEEKHYLKHGRKEGLFHAIDPKRYLNDEREPTKEDTLVFTEGYATGGSVHKLVGKPIIVTFDGDNLVKVAKAMREKFPDVTMLFAADDDHHLPKRETPLPNKGMEKAVEAARAVGGYVVAPPFTKAEKTKGLTDWNDLCQERGQDKTTYQFITQARAALSKNNERELQNEATKSPKKEQEMEMA
ncbi:DUF5710 domain-containing protein [Pseudovibrio sp. Tun.PSC04-5.I4]|uniref:DUF5710 domain-containing protein n=1 Tax=Pseudovibrio sp. Tun.PSC04-5.I4 TaxID=1798213 RepID=UPI00088A0D2E|nr:DUF5710 domain-containing protein [Pseudovibrio sp. Tun.PSC04-5.I4]SDR45080.1 Uncharacterized domain associated with phage/plasmid primase [Pseudovibrio sp. Tun.PSC04-5.I4]